MMRFEGKGSEGAQGSSSGFKTFDVILLRDNRDKESKAGQSLRCSAFKETEVDPLEDRPSDVVHHQETLEDLLQRVAKLQQRVQIIEEQRQSMASGAASGRKRRRRFDEMERDIECKACRKTYGSETALKYHYKLKHGGQPQ